MYLDHFKANFIQLKCADPRPGIISNYLGGVHGIIVYVGGGFEDLL